jgi:hypothetical protein
MCKGEGLPTPTVYSLLVLAYVEPDGGFIKPKPPVIPK